MENVDDDYEPLTEEERRFWVQDEGFARWLNAEPPSVDPATLSGLDRFVRLYQAGGTLPSSTNSDEEES